MIGIYKITSPSNKINIGQSWNIEQRKNTYSQLGCKGQTKLYNSLKKYGFENHKFEIIHELPQDVTQEVLDQYEIFYINQYKDCGFELMNIKDGGSRGKLNEETKQKLSNIKKGKKHSKEHIENIIKSKINSKYKKE
jgi:group I intron endonuclease